MTKTGVSEDIHIILIAVVRGRSFMDSIKKLSTLQYVRITTARNKVILANFGVFSFHRNFQNERVQQLFENKAPFIHTL